jgi:dimethylargininase
MLLALTRAVPPSIARCELTHLDRDPIDVGLAELQHLAYEQALRELGCTVQRLPAEPEMPDSVFVEDAAIVLDEVAVITRPGAASRRGEVPSVAAALEAYRPVLRIEAPGTLDGGDVLRVGSNVFVGLSGRSNAEAVRQLQGLLGAFGYRVTGVEVRGCLHLKSAVTQVDEGTVLLNPEWIDRSRLGDLAHVEVHPEEAMAANALRVGSSVLFPAAFPRTRERLEARGIQVRTVDASQVAKAEGALTCCSLIFETD